MAEPAQIVNRPDLRSVKIGGVSVIKAGRFEYLDGLRGLAALAVVNHHFICAFAPWIFPDPAIYRLLFVAGPLVILRNGIFAVYVFFALSGFVIANSAARKGYSLPVRLLTRYLRLAVPLTCSLLFAFALLSLFPTSRLELARKYPAWIAVVPSRVAALGAKLHRRRVALLSRGRHQGPGRFALSAES